MFSFKNATRNREVLTSVRLASADFKHEVFGTPRGAHSLVHNVISLHLHTFTSMLMIPPTALPPHPAEPFSSLRVHHAGPGGALAATICDFADPYSRPLPKACFTINLSELLIRALPPILVVGESGGRNFSIALAALRGEFEGIASSHDENESLIFAPVSRTRHPSCRRSQPCGGGRMRNQPAQRWRDHCEY